MRLRRRLVGALGAILIAFVLAAPVAADTTPGGGNGTQATAFQDGGCTDNTDGTITCSNTELDASKDKGSGDEVCYDALTFIADKESGDTRSSHQSFGCIDDSGNVTVDKLTSVHVAPTDIALTTVDCVADSCTERDGGTISIAATWAGVGKTFRSTSSSRSRDPFCVEVDRTRSTSRDATFDGPFDASFAQISVGTSSFRIRCT